MRTIDPIKHDQKRQQILEAAERCFTDKGFKGASISAICTEANMSPGHLYHYFANKEAILDAIADRVLEKANGHFANALEHDGAVEGLLGFIDQVRARHERGGHQLILDMFAEASRNPALAAILHEHSRRMRELLTDFLQHAQANGQVDEILDPALAATALIAIIDGAKTMGVRNPELSRSDASDSLNCLVTRLLGAH